MKVCCEISQDAEDLRLVRRISYPSIFKASSKSFLDSSSFPDLREDSASFLDFLIKSI